MQMKDALSGLVLGLYVVSPCGHPEQGDVSAGSQLCQGQLVAVVGWKRLYGTCHLAGNPLSTHPAPGYACVLYYLLSAKPGWAKVQPYKQAKILCTSVLTEISTTVLSIQPRSSLWVRESLAACDGVQ